MRYSLGIKFGKTEKMACDDCTKYSNLCKLHKDQGEEDEAKKAEIALANHKKRARKVQEDISIVRQNAEFCFANSNMYQKVEIKDGDIEKLSAKKPVHKCNIPIHLPLADLETASYSELIKEAKRHFKSFKKTTPAMRKRLADHYYFDHKIPRITVETMPALEKVPVKEEV